MPVIQIVGALAAIAIVAVLAYGRLAVPAAVQRIANLVLLLIAVGIGLWLINTFIPMAESIKAIINIVVVVATCVGVLQSAGLWDRVVAAWNRLTHRPWRTPPPPSQVTHEV